MITARTPAPPHPARRRRRSPPPPPRDRHLRRPHMIAINPGTRRNEQSAAWVTNHIFRGRGCPLASTRPSGRRRGPDLDDLARAKTDHLGDRSPLALARQALGHLWTSRKRAMPATGQCCPAPRGLAVRRTPGGVTCRPRRRRFWSPSDRRHAAVHPPADRRPPSRSRSWPSASRTPCRDGLGTGRGARRSRPSSSTDALNFLADHPARQ